MRRFMFVVVALVMLAVVVGPAVGSAQSANARVRVRACLARCAGG